MASSDPFPLIVPRSTERRMDHFDDTAYLATKGTVLYNMVDALCGTTGAGALINEIFLARAAGAMDTIYFNELDFIFGRISFLGRSPAETYTYNPMIDQLDPKQWDEVVQKDAWYRARIKDFFTACSKGGTPEGIRYAVHAALGVDCDIYEVWRWIDNFGLTQDFIGRSDTRAEVIITPHKDGALDPREIRLLRDMLARIMPVETVVTISEQGMSMSVPVSVTAATADSTYYEVQRVITPTALMDQLPPPELLPIDLLTSEQWMYSKDPVLAPYAAFNMTSEYSTHYLSGNDSRSPIDTVTYGTLQSDGTVATESNFAVYSTDEQFTEWMVYEKADSPDNYPGGKYGLTPYAAPALNPDRTPYVFPWVSQLEFVGREILRIVGLGGIANDNRYRMPLQAAQQLKREFLPEYAIAALAPARESTVSKAVTRRRYRPSIAEVRDPSVFVR